MCRYCGASICRPRAGSFGADGRLVRRFGQSAGVLRRSKGPTVEEASQSAGWRVFQGQYDGRPLLARFNAALRDARDRATFPIQIGVAVPLNAPDDRGMPSGTELGELATIEEQVIEAAAGRAVLVGRSRRTTCVSSCCTPSQANGSRASTTPWKAVKGDEVQVMARADPDWNLYGQFIE
jgi:Family of unknown function (DUF695)